jgi:hypothetical protein
VLSILGVFGRHQYAPAEGRASTTAARGAAVAALGLACLGLYGTISYAVRRRTAELGLLMALGADREAVKWLIVREALLLVLVGGAVGLPLAFLAASCRQFVVRHRSVRSHCVRDGGRRARRRFCVRGVCPGMASVAPRSDDCAKGGVTLELANQICTSSNLLISWLRRVWTPSDV